MLLSEHLSCGLLYCCILNSLLFFSYWLDQITIDSFFCYESKNCSLFAMRSTSFAMAVSCFTQLSMKLFHHWPNVLGLFLHPTIPYLDSITLLSCFSQKAKCYLCVFMLIHTYQHPLLLHLLVLRNASLNHSSTVILREAIVSVKYKFPFMRLCMGTHF